MYPGRRIELIHAAVGNKNGLASFKICDRDDGRSAIASPWLETVNEHYGRAAHQWNRQVTVPMITLDDLVAHFGEPYYIKIDIEGYDGLANIQGNRGELGLDGLSVQPHWFPSGETFS